MVRSSCKAVVNRGEGKRRGAEGLNMDEGKASREELSSSSQQVRLTKSLLDRPQMILYSRERLMPR